MDYFNYKLLPRTPEINAHRRVYLDQYANIAQISQLAVHLLILLYNLATSKNASNSRKDSNGAPVTSKLNKEISRGYGTYGQWIFGLAWTAWLGYLVVAETAPDYMHITKRFGLIAASQLPIHYLLAMPYPNSPLQFLFKSPRSLNLALHKVTGKIIIAFFAAHVALYSSAFVQMGLFWSSISQLKIAAAVISAGILSVLGFTSAGFFRRSRYWWFYRVHVVGSVVILPLLWFHVSHIRIYLYQSGAVVIANTLFRSFGAQK